MTLPKVDGMGIDEETWTTHEHEGKLLIDARWALSYEMVPHAIRSSSPTIEETNARARLAAQAPAMARLLLRAAYDCQFCGSLRLDEHTDACPLVAILRAAGVLP